MIHTQTNSSEQMSLLDVNGLCKTYPDFTLKDVNIQLPKGLIMGFMGRNGAGKSTTIQSIMDLIKPDAGEIKILGMTMTDDEVMVKDQIGYVADSPILNKDWTVQDTLTFTRKFYSNWDINFVDTYLNRFEIAANKKIKNLSKGMIIKFSLILAMAHKPKLLLLDEPTSGLDPIIREEVLDLLLDFLQDDERSILFSSHITTDIEKIADIVTFIHDGEILLSENKEQLLDCYRRIIIKANALDILNHPLLFNCKETIDGYIGYTDDFATFKEKAIGNWEAERLSLEELFVLKTKQTVE